MQNAIDRMISVFFVFWFIAVGLLVISVIIIGLTDDSIPILRTIADLNMIGIVTILGAAGAYGHCMDMKEKQYKRSSHENN